MATERKARLVSYLPAPFRTPTKCEPWPWECDSPLVGIIEPMALVLRLVKTREPEVSPGLILMVFRHSSAE